MFINFSNHPSGGWDEAQLLAARALGGRLVDLAFPMVPPEAGEAEVEALAEDYTDRILALLDGDEADADADADKADADADNVVHVMGELTLTHAVVSRLLDEGVRCVASTTRRDVAVMPDGTKVSRFHFVRFRDY